MAPTDGPALEVVPRPGARPLWTPRLHIEPGWTGWILTGLLVVWVIEADSVPSGNFGHILLAYPATALLVVAWGIRLGIALVARVWKRRVIAWKRFLVQPTLAVVLFTALYTSAPMTVRFDLSRGAMDDTALAVLAGERDPRSIHRIGLYSVVRAERVQGTFRFLVEHTGFLDPGGFVYSPEGPPPVVGEDTYEHYRGPWYLWSESW
jgi:hypothetical protein